MAVEVRGVGTAASGTGAVTPGEPAGSAINDIMYCVVQTKGVDTPAMADMAVWAQRVTLEEDQDNHRITIFWIRRGASAPNLGVDDSGNHTNAQIIGFSGVRATGNPWDVSNNKVETGTRSNNLVVVGGTATVANTMVLVFAGNRRDGNQTTEFSVPVNGALTEITERMDQTWATGSGGGFWCATGKLATAIDWGNTTSTCDTGNRFPWFTDNLKPEAFPTIVADTVDKKDFGLDTTPALQFTGSDGDGDDVSYNIDLTTVIDTYPQTNQDGTYGFIPGSVDGIAQSFAGADCFLGSVKVQLQKLGSPTGTIHCEMYAHNGDAHPDAEPTGPVLATSNSINHTTITTSLIEYTFTFADGFKLEEGTDYFFALISPETDISNRVLVGSDNSSPTHYGNMAIWDGVSTWTSVSTTELCFILDQMNADTLNKDSDAGDGGFTGTGFPDPFTEDTQCTFTVESGDALLAACYFWKVRVKDPDASDTWSAFTTKRVLFIREPHESLIHNTVQQAVQRSAVM